MAKWQPVSGFSLLTVPAILPPEAPLLVLEKKVE